MQNTKGKAIASLVCGIAGVACFWLKAGVIIGIVLGVVAIVLGVQVRKLNDENKNFATAGLVLGIIAVAIDAVIFSCVICAVCTGVGLALAGSSY